jgi:tetratricopeptide (TPR) repeat protein
MNINFQKALMYLDKKNDELAENSLRAAIEEFNEHEETVELISIYCCYGEFLFGMQRNNEALKYLNKVIIFYNENYVPEFEYQRACQLIETILKKA